mgnify:CR=1 FL=1
MRFGAKGLMSTLMRVHISSDAPRCTVQFGALDPRCTMVQVHGDPNEPSLGAGAAGAPCVTLLPDEVLWSTCGRMHLHSSSAPCSLSARVRTRHKLADTGFICTLQPFSPRG